MERQGKRPKHLFIDDTDIEEVRGVSRAFGAFHKHPQNPVLWGDRPWEPATGH